ncbi:hypothetical protein HN51_013181 [Arachis hypogaea]|uniref:uncharacterized protein n=1 Tax=Arachis hypogaea TaxID=3818 RepID=UPI000DEC90EB|nr:uncharacterized protein LOC112791413 [Arachis hypogaea]QHO58847.1 uncharacterized protein DS421_3g94060 [Arachis hypogaea]
MGAEVMVTWGTWEELLLGGAILRHGTRDWTVVAAELSARTHLSPCTFTPEACKAKYEDLQQRYSGNSTTWFEEIRKKRVEELKKALELSEDSIGCLESKLESLKAVKNENIDDCHVGDGSAGPELHAPPQKMARVESSAKETSKDGLSAGSFTHETRPNWSTECQVPAVSSEDVETKPEVARSTDHEKDLDVDKVEQTIDEGKGVSLKKRRGTRKRKDCGKNANEASGPESDNLVSIDASRCKESSTSNCDDVAKSSGIGEDNTNPKKDGIQEMMETLDSILETKGASAFRRRHDSQKRGRYKNMIRQHMDFDTIRTRISNQTIKTSKELFRDFLLLANNALVFYSKCTREYKTALLLRDHVTKILREKLNAFGSSITHANVSTASLTTDPPVEGGTVRPSDCKIAAPATADGSKAPKKASEVASPPSVESLPVKKASGRTKKGGRGAAVERAATPVKGKKRGRAK